MHWGMMPRMGGKKRSGPQEAREVGQASVGRPRTRVPLGAWVMDGGSWRVATVGSGFWQLPGSVVLLVPVCGFCSFSLRSVPSPSTRGVWGGAPRGVCSLYVLKEERENESGDCPTGLASPLCFLSSHFQKGHSRVTSLSRVTSGRPTVYVFQVASQASGQGQPAPPVSHFRGEGN